MFAAVALLITADVIEVALVFATDTPLRFVKLLRLFRLLGFVFPVLLVLNMRDRCAAFYRRNPDLFGCLPKDLFCEPMMNRIMGRPICRAVVRISAIPEATNPSRLGKNAG